MFRSLDRTLLELSAQGELWYQPNPGNAGDALICAATWRRFRSLGLRVLPVPPRGFDSAGKIVLYGGGGNLTPLYNRYRQGKAFVQAHHRQAKSLVVLPHTINGCDELLADLGPNCTLFCREASSFHHCRACAPSANVELSHDIALGLDPDTLPPPGPRSILRLVLRAARVSLGRGRIHGPGLREAARLLALRGRLPRSAGRRGRILDAFRVDVEGISTIPQGNIDLSEELALREMTEDSAAFSAALLLDSLRGWDKVRTDRLHVCIAAALLGIHVEFHPNSYFKCRAVWEHSLRDRFPSIRWMGA